MELLSEAELIAIQDRKFEEVEVPEWNAKVRIGTLSAQHAAESAVAARKGDEVASIRILLAGSLVNKEGKPFDRKTIDALMQKSAAGLTRIVLAARRLNAMTQEAEEQRGEE